MFARANLLPLIKSTFSRSKLCFLDPGLTDDSQCLVVIDVDGDLPENRNPVQMLDSTESIEVLLIEQSQLMPFINSLDPLIVVESSLLAYAMGVHFATLGWWSIVPSGSHFFWIQQYCSSSSSSLSLNFSSFCECAGAHLQQWVFSTWKLLFDINKVLYWLDFIDFFCHFTAEKWILTAYWLCGFTAGWFRNRIFSFSRRNLRYTVFCTNIAIVPGIGAATKRELIISDITAKFY